MLAPLQLFVVDEREHGLSRHTHHGDDEATLDVVAVVRVRVVDDIATRFPERLARPDHLWRFTFEFEEHLAFEHVAERWAARVPVGRSAPAARRVFDDNGHYFGALRDERR